MVALDRRLTGLLRRPYFDRRLRAALARPQRHVQLAAQEAGRLCGFALARLAGGEFGRPQSTLVLETIAVDPQAQRRGVGRGLMDALREAARQRGADEIGTQAPWRNHAMLRFLNGAGFELAPRQIVERAVDRVPLAGDDEDLERMPIPVRHLAAGDFDAVLRIDRASVREERSAYLQRKFDEVLDESAMELSLVAEQDGLPVGFVMARVDFGEFGHVEGTAALDTIGVLPGFARHGVGRALLGQLVNNLAALHVERLETEVARETFALLGFLYRHGFGPSQSVPFRRRTA